MSETIHQSPLSERAVLSAMLRSETHRKRAIVEGLTAEHFFRYGPVFTAIRDLSRAGSPVDDATVAYSLEESGDLAAAGGADFIADLWRETTEPKGWRSWVKDLNAAHAKRIMDDGLALAQSVKTAEQQMSILRETQDAVKTALAGPPRAKTAREAVALATAELEYLANAGAIPGIATKMAELDEITGGMKRGQLWSILAKTSRGKSVLMSQLVCAALEAERKAIVFSAEMMVHEVVFRKVSHRGRIDMAHLMNPRGAGGYLKQVLTQLKLLADTNLWIDDSPKMTLAHIEGEAMRVADANDGLDLIAVDYLQILKAERARGMNREEVVAQLSGGLKQLAKRMDCPVITASQVNKEGGARESEAIAFDSDVMLAIGPDGIRLSKVRNGKRDTVIPYELVGEYQTFVRFNPETGPSHSKEDEQADREADLHKHRGGGRNRQFKS